MTKPQSPHPPADPVLASLNGGRGAMENPAGRFEPLTLEADTDAAEAELADPDDMFAPTPIRTEVFYDRTKSIISTNDSPDIGMDATVNPYRGCEHGCIYCFARPTHEYLGLSAGLDFETKIFAKPDAPRLLAEKLSSKNWQPAVIFMSGVTDPYQPLERKLKITRGCIEVLADFHNPVSFITKNALIARDIDLLSPMASLNLTSVNFSVTTLDRKLARAMEPRATTPLLRLKAIEQLAKAGIPVTVLIGPVLPGLTEHEIPAILKSAADAGAVSAGYTMLRLPYGVKDLFQTWLHEHFPDRADKVLNRIRAIRDGKLNDAEFGARMRGEGFYAEQIAQIFTLARRRFNLTRRITLSTAHFRRDAHSRQFSLF
ncbi:MAG: PA0069 family radical SAM protein [Micavibrio sp.]|nr:PA0069 family radical SAM protein [Micavibrio sp.]